MPRQGSVQLVNFQPRSALVLILTEKISQIAESLTELCDDNGAKENTGHTEVAPSVMKMESNKSKRTADAL